MDKIYYLAHLLYQINQGLFVIFVTLYDQGDKKWLYVFSY